MKNIFTNEVLVRAAKEILKEYAEMKFLVDYVPGEKQTKLNTVLNLMESVLERIRNTHPDGEKLYTVLFNCHFSGKKVNRTMLCEKIGMETAGRELTVSTLYRWQMEAIRIYACILWADPQFTDESLKLFQSTELKKDYSKICEEWKKLKNA